MEPISSSLQLSALMSNEVIMRGDLTNFTLSVTYYSTLAIGFLLIRCYS
jgi:hypothetical protein